MGVAPALWIWLALEGASTPPAPSLPAPAPTAPEGLSAELQAGVHAPLGAAGFALVQSIGRLTLGAGVGMDPRSAAIYQDSSRLRAALFVRARLVDRSRFHLALGAGISNMPELVERVEDGRLITWQRQGQLRTDATLTGEAPVGPLWLGLALGVGRVSGAISCHAQNLTPGPDDPVCTSANEPPPTWIPFVALAARRRIPGGTGITSQPAQPGPPQGGRELRLFLSGSTVGAFDVLGEMNLPDTNYGAGVESDLLWRRGSHLRLGLGLRYELAHGYQAYTHTSVTDHFLYLPVLLGVAARLAGDSELDFQVGLGLAGGRFRPEPALRAPAWRTEAGGMAEISIDYWTPIARSLDLSIGIAARGALLDQQYLKRFLPLRVGLRWGTSPQRL